MGIFDELDYGYKFAREGLTFDDVLLVPAKSEVLPADVSTATVLAGDIRLNTPFLTAAEILSLYRQSQAPPYGGAFLRVWSVLRRTVPQ